LSPISLPSSSFSQARDAAPGMSAVGVRPDHAGDSVAIGSRERFNANPTAWKIRLHCSPLSRLCRNIASASASKASPMPPLHQPAALVEQLHQK